MTKNLATTPQAPQEETLVNFFDGTKVLIQLELRKNRYVIDFYGK